MKANFKKNSNLQERPKYNSLIDYFNDIPISKNIYKK